MKKNLLLLIFFIALLGFTSNGQNLISNGSFENNFANWNNLAGGSSSAAFSIETVDIQDGAKAMKVVVTTPGANAYDVQSINSSWASATGNLYTLTFFAKAATNGITVRAVQQTNTYAQKDFTLTTTWQKYEWTFTAQEANLQLRFDFPVAGTFYIDNVNIPAVTNLIPNGGFENDFTNWTNLAGGSSSATFSVETADKVEGNKAMKVSVVTPGANAYDVQSINSAWASVAGNVYTLSFYAKSNVGGRKLRAVQQTSTYAQKDFTLTTAWAKYEWIFTAQEANLKLRFNFPEAGTFYIDTVSIPTSNTIPAYTPTGPPIATGKPKFLGCAYSPAQKVNFAAYFNQVTPENDGKWGVVEAARDVMNWAGLDSAYKLAKHNGFPFKMHTLVWGNQQPAWIETLPPAEQLEEIKEWFAAVAARYPAIDIIEVVNEPINDPPNSTGNGGGNYINALGGSGTTGYDWIINSFKLARQYFPVTTKLWINEFNIVNSPSRTQQYLEIINLLKGQNLIDGVGVQAHAFSTTASSETITTNLNTLSTTGLPLYATELDIDGSTDQVQLDAYKRIFPLFWEHAAVKGVTLWGYRPGHWRTAQRAYIVQENGIERPAMVWLKEYVANTTPITFNWTGNVNTAWENSANWAGNAVPTSTSNVIIVNGKARYPMISLSTTINSLYLASGTSITTASGVALTILSN
ncbi:MAG: xylanase [Segetibacter sp.]|nr:xylanase [Segetibacter sp.]